MDGTALFPAAPSVAVISVAQRLPGPAARTFTLSAGAHKSPCSRHSWPPFGVLSADLADIPLTDRAAAHHIPDAAAGDLPFPAAGWSSLHGPCQSARADQKAAHPGRAPPRTCPGASPQCVRVCFSFPETVRHRPAPTWVQKPPKLVPVLPPAQDRCAFQERVRTVTTRPASPKASSLKPAGVLRTRCERVPAPIIRIGP